MPNMPNLIHNMDFYADWRQVWNTIYLQISYTYDCILSLVSEYTIAK